MSPDMSPDMFSHVLWHSRLPYRHLTHIFTLSSDVICLVFWHVLTFDEYLTPETFSRNILICQPMQDLKFAGSTAIHDEAARRRRMVHIKSIERPWHVGETFWKLKCTHMTCKDYFNRLQHFQYVLVSKEMNSNLTIRSIHISYHIITYHTSSNTV